MKRKKNSDHQFDYNIRYKNLPWQTNSDFISLNHMYIMVKIIAASLISLPINNIAKLWVWPRNSITINCSSTLLIYIYCCSWRVWDWASIDAELMIPNSLGGESNQDRDNEKEEEKRRLKETMMTTMYCYGFIIRRKHQDKWDESEQMDLKRF